jgi:hypothetical protein
LSFLSKAGREDLDNIVGISVVFKVISSFNYRLTQKKINYIFSVDAFFFLKSKGKI